MSFTGVNVNKLQGGLGRTGDQADRVVVLVCGVAPIAGKVEHYKQMELLLIDDAENKGLTFDRDIANDELVNYHLSEIFRLSPEQKAWLIPVPKDKTIAEIVAESEFKAALRAISGSNTIGFAGIKAAADLTADINAAQKLVNDFNAEFHYIDAVIVEGKGAFIPSIVTDFEDLRALDAPNVSVAILADPAIIALNSAYAGHAAIGTVLGSLSVRAVHENVGSVDIEVKPRAKRGTPNYDISDQQTGRWLDIALSNGVLFNTLSLPAQNEITKRGYIFAGSFQGYAGVFLSNSPTCVNITSDYAYIEYNAVWNKGAKIVRNTLLSRVRSKVETDPATGFVKSTTITHWDGIVRAALEDMVTAGNISAFDIHIDPKQKAISTAPFKAKLQLVAHGIVHEFDIDLGYTTKI